MELTVKEVQETVSKLNMILLLALSVAVVTMGIPSVFTLSKGATFAWYSVSIHALAVCATTMIMRTMMQKEHRKLNTQV